MDFALPADDDPRRLEVRAWLAAHPSPSRRDLAVGGFIAPHWPSPWGRDADAEAQAEVLGLDEAPEAQAVVGNSLWPIFGALGIGALAVGLVVHPVIFVTGLCILVAVAIEWTMTYWSEKVSGDEIGRASCRERG